MVTNLSNSTDVRNYVRNYFFGLGFVLLSSIAGVSNFVGFQNNQRNIEHLTCLTTSSDSLDTKMLVPQADILKDIGQNERNSLLYLATGLAVGLGTAGYGCHISKSKTTEYP